MDDADERRISLTIRMVLDLQVAQGIASGGNQFDEDDASRSEARLFLASLRICYNICLIC